MLLASSMQMPPYTQDWVLDLTLSADQLVHEVCQYPDTNVLAALYCVITLVWDVCICEITLMRDVLMRDVLDLQGLCHAPCKWHFRSEVHYKHVQKHIVQVYRYTCHLILHDHNLLLVCHICHP